jgi:hypothetical protein
MIHGSAYHLSFRSDQPLLDCSDTNMLVSSPNFSKTKLKNCILPDARKLASFGSQLEPEGLFEMENNPNFTVLEPAFSTSTFVLSDEVVFHRRDESR